MDPSIRIHQVVSDFVENITQLARQVALDMVVSAFSAPTGPAAGFETPAGGRARRGGKSTRAVGLRRGRRRAAGDVERLKTRFLDHVRAHPGQRIEQINRALGTRTPEMRLPLAKLLAAKQIKTKGERRATTYFAT
ncbi:MAG: hypothetical protein K8H88_22960 [Sandaracinaceae bacterium]|nr:hypothetical protein [Sandaracinaceae bacterium]